MGGQLIEDVADSGDSKTAKGMLRKKKATCITVGWNNNYPLEQGNKDTDVGLTRSANGVNMERVVKQTVGNLGESSRARCNLVESST